MEIINYIAISIAIAAASIICWGVLLGLIRFVKLEFQRVGGKIVKLECLAGPYDKTYLMQLRVRELGVKKILDSSR